jgi:hypothetical protein
VSSDAVSPGMAELGPMNVLWDLVMGEYRVVKGPRRSASGTGSARSNLNGGRSNDSTKSGTGLTKPLMDTHCCRTLALPQFGGMKPNMGAPMCDRRPVALHAGK